MARHCACNEQQSCYHQSVRGVQPTRELEALDLQFLTEAFRLLGEQGVNMKPLGNVLQARAAQRNDRAEIKFLRIIAVFSCVHPLWGAQASRLPTNRPEKQPR